MKINWLAGTTLALVGALAVGVTFASALKAGSFDPPRTAPDFVLQGTDGHDLRMSQYRGKVVLLSFGYSSCQAVCPVTLNTLAQAHRLLGPAANNVQVIYVTVDPERDTPPHLQAFLQQFDTTFLGGTGTAANLAAVRKDYGISAHKIPVPGSYMFDHSSFVYLIDRSGRIRALMPYGHSPQDYVHDLSLLLKE